MAINVSEELLKRLEELETENKELRTRLAIGATEKVTIGHSEENPKFACAGCNKLYAQQVIKKGKCPFCRAEDELKEFEDTDKVLKRYAKGNS